MRPYKLHTQSAQDYNFVCPTRIHFSILRLILTKLSINYLFIFVAVASLYNIADENTLSELATTVLESIKILEADSEVVID